MSPHTRFLAPLLVLSVGLAACGDDDPQISLDSGVVVDLGTRDLGVPADSGVRDLGTPADTGVADLGQPDAAEPDAAEPDASEPDAAEPDASAPDAAETDAAEPDAGEADSGPVDAGCVPSGDEVCDGQDNDCNGQVDDVDEDENGLYDCSRIAIFGGQASVGTTNFISMLEANSTALDRLMTTTTASITEAVLSNYDLVLIDNLVREYTEEEAELFRLWVEAGGGVMSMTGYTGSDTERARANSLLGVLGFNYISGLQSGPVTTFVSHATTSSITSIVFLGGFRVEVLPGPTVSTSTVVARLAAGPVGVAGERGAGRVFSWGDEWIQANSEFTNVNSQVPRFWANILGWLRHWR